MMLLLTLLNTSLVAMVAEQNHLQVTRLYLRINLYLFSNKYK